MKKLYFITLISLTTLSLISCGTDDEGQTKQELEAQTKAFNTLSSDVRFVSKSIQTKNAKLYTQAGRLVRFEHKGHKLKLEDTAGVINGFIREDNGTLLYIPATDGVKATDTLVYTDDGRVKTVAIQINSDPLYSEQWHLHNTGQTSFTDLDIAADGKTDLNMQNALASGYLGEGVTVAVVDSGVDIEQPDLIESMGYGSMDLHSYKRDHITIKSTKSHGTEVAGIIAAHGWNFIGGRGVSPDAKIISYNYLEHDSEKDFIKSHGLSNAFESPNLNKENTFMLTSLPKDKKEAKAIISNLKEDDLARIYNESWYEIFIASKENNGKALLRNAVVRKGVLEGSHKKGNIYIKIANNNERFVFEKKESLYVFPADLPLDYFSPTLNNTQAIRDANHGLPFAGAMLESYNNSPYVIVVGAVTAQGKQATYSSSGSNVFISGLAGEMPAGRIITTDFSGCVKGSSNLNAKGIGMNAFDTGELSVNDHCDYVASMDGTSAAAPTVSGAIADILSANLDLTWRDVKYILANTAKKLDPESPSIRLNLDNGSLVAQYGWITNKAGYHFNNRYGFGLVDIDAAIKMALSYKPDSQGKYKEYQELKKENLSLAIPDSNASGVSDSLTEASDAIVETVQLHVDIKHERINDLQIQLTSPSGTTAIILNPYAGFKVERQMPNAPKILRTSNGINLMFNINTFYGESMKGDWKIQIFDVNRGDYIQKQSNSLDVAAANLVHSDNNATPGTLKSWSIQINGHDK